MTEVAKRPSMDELLAKKGPSKMASAKTPGDAMRVALGQDNSEGKAAVSTETTETTLGEAKATEAKAEDATISNADGETADKKSKKSSETVPSSSKFAELRIQLREARDKIKKLEAVQTEDKGYYDTGAQINAADQPETSGSIYQKYLEDKFVSSWLSVKDKLGDDPAGDIFSEFEQLCTEQEESSPNEPRIWDTMYSQPNPGRFILDYVEQYKEQSKYGTTPKEWKNNIRAEVEKEVAEKVKNELMKKYNIRDQLPRDVIGSRAASGGEVTPERPSSDYLFNKRKYERFRTN